MVSQALDFVTIGHALDELTRQLGVRGWHHVNPAQRSFLEWFRAHRAEIVQLDGLNVRASEDYTKLNRFLEEHGFDPQFKPFDGVGVASILDMLVEWLVKGSVTSIDSFDRGSGEVIAYPAFSIPASGVEIFDLVGYNHPLVRLNTKTGHSLWLMVVAEPTSGVELALEAQRVLQANRTVSARWTVGAHIPMLEMDIKPALEWMLGAHTEAENYWQIVQAFQQFRLRANERGARVKVATGLGAMRGASFRPVPYKFDRPFLGFFTQPGHDNLALAGFWADRDSWRASGEELEAL